MVLRPVSTAASWARFTTRPSSSVICPKTSPIGNNYFFFTLEILVTVASFIVIFLFSADWYKDDPLVGGPKEVGDRVVIKNRKQRNV